MVASTNDKNCTFLISADRATLSQDDICKELESPDMSVKINALKAAIAGMLAGEAMPRVLMTVIRFCITQDDHMLKKLLMLYWEVVPKYGADGKLLPEMILVCNALRNDLMSPNEYIRGSMLRFLCKLKEPELLEPLIPSIKLALEHRHSYVRRNAALAVYSIHRNFGEHLLPDGPELMEKFILEESDIGARRNAFLMLFNEAEAIAIDFMTEHIDDIQKFGDGFALMVLELTRKTCRRDPAQKSRFVRCLFLLLRSDSPAVSYEAAWTLVSLSTAPTAVRACSQTYANLLNNNSDNNVKMIVLDRLTDLKKHHGKVVEENLMDILRALSSPNIDISKKTLALAIDMVGPRNIESVMQTLKREVVRTQESDMEHGEEYKNMLIQAIHKCAIKYAEIADSVVLVLLDFLSGESGYTVMQCVKNILEQYPTFRPSIIRKLIDQFDEITSSDAYRVSLWILGEYSIAADPTTGQPMTQNAFEAITGAVGSGPFQVVKEQTEPIERGGPPGGAPTVITKNVVLADGTYATVTETVGGPSAVIEGQERASALRKLIVDGDLLVGTVASVCCTKMCLRTGRKEASLMEGTLKLIGALGKYAEVRKGNRSGVNADCISRLSQCARVLLDPSVRNVLAPVFLESCREAYSDMVSGQKAAKAKAMDAAKIVTQSQADDLIQFRQLRSQAVQGGIELDLMDADDISRAVGAEGSTSAHRMRHVYQLTGFSDPVYAEAIVTVHDFDIILEMLVINRTPHTLTNLTVELATMGDLKLVERPQSYTIGPNNQHTLRANIKVSSTETGHIFGTIVFDTSSNATKSYVSLNDIQLDIMDYIHPAECNSDAFRSMWAEFEWENKVAINTNITDLRDFLAHIITNTNMTCLTPLGDNYSALIGSNFLAANLYAKSVFSEDALVNLSVERKEEGEAKLCGYIRIRSKTQGIALSLGDRITTVLRRVVPPEATPENPVK